MTIWDDLPKHATILRREREISRAFRDADLAERRDSAENKIACGRIGHVFAFAEEGDCRWWPGGWCRACGFMDSTARRVE